MNHEQRIASLERQVAKLQEIIEGNGLDKKFVTVPEASLALKINPWVLRDRIRNDKTLILGKHFLLNGKRYLINLAEWKKLIAADVEAKRL